MLDQALLEVEQLLRAYEPTTELNALYVTTRRIADTCRLHVEAFLERIKRYNPPLAGNGSGNKNLELNKRISYAVSEML
jgi:hypothetical protein